MNDEIYIVTGSNSGIGRAIVELLAEQGRAIIMACRNVGAATKVRNEIAQRTGNNSIEVRHLDLSSQASIRAFIENAQTDNLKIAALINNAGMIARNFSINPDSGLENTIATNYLGTAALTLGLLPLIKTQSNHDQLAIASFRQPIAPVIINTLSLSVGFVRPTRKIFIPNPHHFNSLTQYALSKLALMYFTARLAHENPHIRIVATDPGIVNTNIMRLRPWLYPLIDLLFSPFTRRPRTAAKITLRALADSSSLTNRANASAQSQTTATLYKGRRTARPLKTTLATSPYGDWLRHETQKLTRLQKQ